MATIFLSWLWSSVAGFTSVIFLFHAWVGALAVLLLLIGIDRRRHLASLPFYCSLLLLGLRELYHDCQI